MLKILSRNSPLALAQVKEVMENFPNIVWEIIPITTFGDIHRDISLLDEDTPSDLFTREIDEALILGKGDIAIHSAKDLPYPLDYRLDIIALTEPINKTDSLVSIKNIKLEDLPPKSRIGTSSIIRKKQLLLIRKDIEIVSVRGNIEERIALVDSKIIDAVVVATCALKRLKLTNRITQILPCQTHPLQGSLAVVACKGRPELKALFQKIDSRRKYGKVWLVGAGPGDVEFLTIKAQKILSIADIIYYDDLINNEILNFCKGEQIYVGKRKWYHEYEQEIINEMLYQSAIKGKNVVRLKGGDPLIFSRGGEELVYLQKRLVPTEVIPGLSAIQVSAASTKIPLTLRGISRSLGIASGHYSGTNDITVMNTDTSVYYMAAEKLKKLSKMLQDAGYTCNTPVAIVRNAGLSNEECIITTLEKLGDIIINSPITVIVGKVVKNFYLEEKVLYTGIDPQNFYHIGRIVHYPLIETIPVDFNVNNFEYDTVLFTSKNAVKYYLDKNSIVGKRIVVIGKVTQQAVNYYGYHVHYVADKPSSLSLKKLIRENAEWRILYPCSDLSNNSLHILPNVKPLIVYKTRARIQKPIDLKNFSTIVFTSPSTVDSFFKIYSKVPLHLLCLVMGHTTKKRLIDYGVAKEKIAIHELK